MAAPVELANEKVLGLVAPQCLTHWELLRDALSPTVSEKLSELDSPTEVVMLRL